MLNMDQHADVPQMNKQDSNCEPAHDSSSSRRRSRTTSKPSPPLSTSAAQSSGAIKPKNEADEIAILKKRLITAEEEHRKTREELESRIRHLQELIDVQTIELSRASAPVLGTVLAQEGIPSAPPVRLESTIVTNFVTNKPKTLYACACDNCGICIYPGNWYRCNMCLNFDLCFECLKLAGGAHKRAANTHSFGDMKCVLRTSAGFPKILNLNTYRGKFYKEACCNICGEAAYFHCNLCAEYDLCDKHIVTDLWFSHAAHGTEATFTNLWLRERIKGV